jgi:hypothetical protein
MFLSLALVCLASLSFSSARAGSLVAIRKNAAFVACVCSWVLLPLCLLLPCPWAWHKLQLSPESLVAKRSSRLLWNLAKSSNCSAQVGAGVRLALPLEHSELKEKSLLMEHTNDLYILITNAWVKITRWNLNELGEV